MIVYTHDSLGRELRQGSAEWWDLRRGIPTASEFHRIITEKRLDYAAAATKYLAELLAEDLLGEPLDWGSTEWTERGHDMEARARTWYELRYDVEVETVCFVTDDLRTEGGSPDGLVGSDGVVEIKGFGALHHVECLLGYDEIAKRTQVQGLLRVTEREWVDSVAYNPRLPKKIVRTYRDDVFQKALDGHLERFKAELADAKERLAAMTKAGVVDGSLVAALEASLTP